MVVIEDLHSGFLSPTLLRIVEMRGSNAATGMARGCDNHYQCIPNKNDRVNR